MDVAIDSIIAFFEEFKTFGPAGKIGVLGGLVALVSATWAVVRSRTKAKLHDYIKEGEELRAQISERDKIIKDLRQEVEAWHGSHPDVLLDEIEREEKDRNEDLAVQKSNVLFGNLREPLLKACRVLAGHHLARSAGPAWQKELAAADRYVTIGHAVDPADAALRALALEITSAKREEAELRRAFDEAEAQTDKIYEELAPSGDDDVGLVNRLFSAHLRHYKSGRYVIAGHLIRRAWLLLKGREGPNHIATLTAQNNLALCLDRQGRYGEAEAHYHEVIEKQEKVFEPDHPDTVTTRGNLARCLGGQGRHDEAEPLLREALEKRQKILEPDHSDTLRMRRDLGSCLNHQGRFKEAEVFYREALEKQEKVLERDHPDTLSTRGGLASCLDHQARHEEAEALYRVVIQKQEQVLEPDHPDTLSTLCGLASCLVRQGRHEEAEALYRKVIEKQEKILAPDHPDTLITRHCLAICLDHEGRREEAKLLMRAVFETRKRVLGPDHPGTQSTQVWLRKLDDGGEPSDRPSD